MKVFLLGAYRFFVILNLAFYTSVLLWAGYVLYRNNSGMDLAGKVFIEKELGLKNFKVKKHFAPYFEAFVLPTGLWWLELDEPFSPEMINNSKLGLFKYFDYHFATIAKNMYPVDYYQYNREQMTPEEIIQDQIFRSFGEKTSGFETYVGVKVHLGDDTVCYADNCDIVIFAKEGDKNLIFQISAYMTDRRREL